MNKQARLLAVPLALAAGLLVAGTGASADSGRVSAQYQGYSSSTGQNPYASSNPADVHVGGYGGMPVVTGYVRLNLDSLPPNSTINGLVLTLVPNSSQTDNVNSSTASLQACALTDTLNSNGFQANPPAYSCDTHAVAELQANGDWTIELAPLAAKWKTSNTGMALVAFPPPNGTPVSVAVAPSAWSVAFDHTRTAASVDYTPGSASAAGSLVPAASQPGSSLAPAAPPAVAPAAPLPQVGTPNIAPTSAPVARPASTPVVVEKPRLEQQWLWVTAALGAAALLMLLVGAGQYVLRTGHFRPGLALAASRSQLATPISVLSLAAVFALGSTTQMVSVIQQGPGGLAQSGAGGTTAGGGGTSEAGGGGNGALTPGQQAVGNPGTTAGIAAGSAGSGANSPLNGPGVTSTTVRIGFAYTVNGQSANQAFGFKTPNTGNQQAEEQALVDYINHHGGLAGRQVQPVYIAYDNARAESDPTINEELCHQFTEDYHVFAVVGGGGPPDDTAANACYAQAGTLNFDLEQAEPNLAFLKQTSPYIWLTSAAALDRMMSIEIAGLQHQGYFAQTPTYKLGVVEASDSVNDQVYNQVTLPGLRAAGVKTIENFPVPHDTVSDVANTLKQAAARFQIDQVTNVIFQGGGNYGTGSYASLFMLDAQSDTYTPTYGLNSDDGPVGIAGQIPETQLKGARVVGISGVDDTDDQHYLPWPSTPNEKKCADLETAAGNSFTSRLNAGVSIYFCNAVFELQQGAQPLAGGPLNTQLWADQVMRLGSGVYNASMYRAYVGPGHWDAAGGYRLLHAVQNCEGSNACFVYDDPNIYG